MDLTRPFTPPVDAAQYLRFVVIAQQPGSTNIAVIPTAISNVVTVQLAGTGEQKTIGPFTLQLSS